MTDPNTVSDSWEERKPVQAPAVQITFFEDRAEVVRRAIVQVPAGCSWVTLLGAGVFLDDPSVVVKVRGDGVRTLSTRVLRSMRSISELGPDEVKRLEAESRKAERERKEAEQGLDRVDRARSRTTALVEAWAQAMERTPRAAQDGMEGWKASFEELQQRMLEALDRAGHFRTEARQAKRAESQALLRLDLGKRVSPDYRAAIEVQLESQTEQQIELEATYRTPCAVWRPEHVARLVTNADGSHELEVLTLATVWQATGEAWDGVQCKFSTARPARSASPPLLSEDVISSRRKTDQERKQVVVEQRDEAIAKVGIDRGTRKVEEMPGVDDGGEPVNYEASRPCTVVSDGYPFRVELVSRRMPCKVDRVAYPEVTEAVHYRATATLGGSTPLLAGPVWIARGSAMVGRSKTGFVGQGEPFELGMGMDDGLRVRRTFEEKRDTTPVIGTQKINRKVQLFVSNLSGSERSLQVVERYPVSELEDVKVELTSHREGQVNARDGFVRYDVTVPRSGTKELLLEYRIEAASRVVM